MGVTNAAKAGQVALARAERSVKWATSSDVVETIPSVAGAARRMAMWLRSAGIALSETARLLLNEKRDKRTQRRLLHDEIHVLRQQADALQAALHGDRSKLVDTEAAMHQLVKQRDADITELRASLDECQQRATATEERLRETSAQLKEAEAKLQQSVSELSATAGMLAQQRAENDGLRNRANSTEEQGVR